MGLLYLTVQLWSSAFNVGMADALIFDVPVKLGLKLMAVIGSDLFDAEGELFDDVIDKVDRVCLCVFGVNLESPDTCSVVYRGILEAADLLAALADEDEELNVHLDVMAGHLLVLTSGVDFAHAGSTRQPTNTVAAQNASHTSVGDCDAGIACKVPDDPDRHEVVFASQA